MTSAYKIAEAYVEEYLSREPEYMDMLEFIAEEEYEIEDDQALSVFNYVVGLLEDEAQRFADRNN